MLLLLALGAWLSPVWYDDAGHYIVIREWLQGRGFCYPGGGGCDPDSPFITLGRPLNLAYGGFMSLFGEAMWVGRVLTVLFSGAAMWAMGELTRRFFSGEKAVWAILLVIGNIQFMTYGAQILGEMPMLACLLWGLLAHGLWQDGRGKVWAVFGPVFWFGAVMCKAYIAVPIAVALAAWLIYLLVKGEKRLFGGAFLQAMAWGLGLIGYFILEQGGWTSFVAFLQERGSYGSEFFALDFAEALRYLALKPLFWLGTAALFLRLYFRRRAVDCLLAAFHLALTIFFLLSAGYDRFGFLLLFIPAVFLSELLSAAWTRLQGKTTLRLALACFAFLIFYQQSPMAYGRRLLEPEAVNLAERKTAAKILEHASACFTYDQQIVPFLAEDLHFRLPAVVPSNADQCQPLQLRAGELFVAGEYARTTYRDCVPWQALQRLDSVEWGGAKYVLWVESVSGDGL